MAAVNLAPEDLAPFADIDEAKALVMIEDAVAMAARVAPCIADDDFEHEAAAKAVIRGAILRWNEAGQGALTQQGAGPFQQSIDTRTARRGMFWPSEISDLQSMCRQDREGAFSVDTAPAGRGVHADACSLNLGATYCSCMADIAGFPLYGV